MLSRLNKMGLGLSVVDARPYGRLGEMVQHQRLFYCLQTITCTALVFLLFASCSCKVLRRLLIFKLSNSLLTTWNWFWRISSAPIMTFQKDESLVAKLETEDGAFNSICWVNITSKCFTKLAITSKERCDMAPWWNLQISWEVKLGLETGHLFLGMLWAHGISLVLPGTPYTVFFHRKRELHPALLQSN